MRTEHAPQQGLPEYPMVPYGHTRWAYFPPLTPCSGEICYGTADWLGDGYHDWASVGPLREGFSGNEQIHYIVAVKDEPAEGWIAFADRRPEAKDYPIFTGSNLDDSRYYIRNAASGFSDHFTHWMRDTTPPIPEKVKTQEERDNEALDAFIATSDYWTPFNAMKEKRAFWNAALEYARKEGK